MLLEGPKDTQAAQHSLAGMSVLAGCLAGCMAGWLAVWPALPGCLAAWPICCLAACVAACPLLIRQASRPAGWQAGCV